MSHKTLHQASINSSKSLKQRLLATLFEARDISALVVFRVAFGTIMLWEAIRYIKNDWIREFWMSPGFNFTYEWFEWVKPWSGDGMIFHFYLLSILSVLIILGLFYRVAMCLMFLAFSYVFLLEQSRYLNHFYLVVLISFLMIFIPAHKKYSLDALLWKNIKSDYVPAWTIMLLQFQIGIAYFFGGIAKMNYDWLILAEPMQHWLGVRKGFPLIGQFFGEPWMAYFMSWSGCFLDLLAPFLLISRRTRPYMFAAILTFHFMNDRLFQIGIFPWFMIIASTIFFHSDWVERLKSVVRDNHSYHRGAILIGTVIFAQVGLYFHTKPEINQGFELVPVLVAGLSGGILTWLLIDLFTNQNSLKRKTKNAAPGFVSSNIIVIFLGCWVFVQILLPLRHYLIPGNVSWTEEGHRFAWHMMLRSKDGRAYFYVYNPATKRQKRVNLKKYLKSWQYDKMKIRPHLIHQFAKYLGEELKKEGKGNYEIRVKAVVHLNYRSDQYLINPEVDLSREAYSEFQHSKWIVQLNENSKPGAFKSIDKVEELYD